VGPSYVPRPSRGLSLGGFLAFLFGTVALVMALALGVVTVLFVRERKLEAARYAQLRASCTAAESTSDDHSPAPTSSPHHLLPAITRHVPNHPLRMLEGCSGANLATINEVIGEAIQVGAPLFNDGNFAGCYHTYVGAALTLENQLPKTCAGPSKALASGRKTADGLDHVGAQAWAMRDAFDGLLDVIERSQEGGGGANL
jgi:hypothetical protein